MTRPLFTRRTDCHPPPCHPEARALCGTKDPCNSQPAPTPACPISRAFCEKCDSRRPKSRLQRINLRRSMKTGQGTTSVPPRRSTNAPANSAPPGPPLSCPPDVCHPERGFCSGSPEQKPQLKDPCPHRNARVRRGTFDVKGEASQDSREAAKECSPRRKPWVDSGMNGTSPEGAKENHTN